MTAENQNLLPPEERVLSTLEADGSRRWLHPRLAKGKTWHARRWVAYGLIAFFTVVPWLRWNGQPLVLLDIPNREFLLLGTTFLPTDTLPLAFAILAIFLTVFFLTAVLGRVWCGWGCPQTVYLEFVFRPIERLFAGRAGVGGKPAKPLSGLRTLGMYTLFLIICAHLTNTFLAYFVGTDNLTRWIWTSPPWEHPAAFLLFLGVTGFMMFDFCYWREQLCIIGCPYGRFQSVMLDRQSIIISYDPHRGEPRGKPRKKKGLRGKGAEKQSEDVALPVVGDCVDCGQCVQVCPTGIDIRDGLQMECINCAQCIDACNDIMARFDRPPGLIRYSSQDAIDRRPGRLLRPRVILYPLAVIALLAALVVFLINKPTSDIIVLRTLGRPFAVSAEGLIDNTLRVKVTNRTDAPRTYRVLLPEPASAVVQAQPFTLEPGATLTQPVRILLPYDAFTGGRREIELLILDDLDTVFPQDLELSGPTAPPAVRVPENSP
jgi:cytochrome c oxidase accessory protein FixG